MSDTIKPKAIDWHRKKGRTTTAIVECQCGRLHDLPMPATMLANGYPCAGCGQTVQDGTLDVYTYPPTRITRAT